MLDPFDGHYCLRVPHAKYQKLLIEELPEDDENFHQGGGASSSSICIGEDHFHLRPVNICIAKNYPRVISVTSL